MRNHSSERYAIADEFDKRNKIYEWTFSQEKTSIDLILWIWSLSFLIAIIQKLKIVYHEWNARLYYSVALFLKWFVINIQTS